MYDYNGRRIDPREARQRVADRLMANSTDGGKVNKISEIFFKKVTKSDKK